MDMYFALLSFFVLICYTRGGSPSNSSRAFSEILKTYDKRVRPYAENGTAKVTLQISVLAIGPVNEKDFSYRIDYFMRQWWSDERLKFSKQKGEVTFNGNPKDLIWLPDLFIRNSRQIIKHAGMTETIRTTVYNDGNVYMSSRVSAINSCNMELQQYPMDNQTCKLIFESYAYNGNELDISWHQNPIEYNIADIQIEGYKLEKITSTRDAVKYVTGEFFPLLQINIYVLRTLSYYIYRSYIPSSFLVVMTWGTFWLPATTYPARVGIIVTNFLASSFILQGASAMYTKVPYTTAIEVFLLVNISFILAVMLEYIAVIQTPNFSLKKLFSRKTNKEDSVESNGTINGSFTICRNEKTVDEKRTTNNNATPKVKTDDKVVGHILDQMSRVVFPLMYAIFLLSYFIKNNSI